jgi:uncharacterized membrane protein YobD (UPF0266 family)
MPGIKFKGAYTDQARPQGIFIMGIISFLKGRVSLQVYIRRNGLYRLVLFVRVNEVVVKNGHGEEVALAQSHLLGGVVVPRCCS